MPSPSVTNTFSNGTTADATQVNTNFTDIINALTDGLKDLVVSSINLTTLTVSGVATFNGAVGLGNAAADAITITGTPTFSTAITITATTNQIVLGVTNTTTINATAPSASRVYTLGDAGGAANFVLSSGALTSGRVPFVNANGVLVDDSDMSFSADTLTVTKLIASTSATISGLTSGRLVLASTSGLLSDSSSFTYSGNTLTAHTLTVSTGNLTLSNGNLVLGANKYVDFSATSSGTTGTATGKLFNDYEIGSFVPVLKFGTTAQSYAASGNVGTYVKAGVFVHFTIWINISGKSGSGNATIEGLPFATFNSTNQYNAFHSGYAAALTTATDVSGYVIPNASIINLYYDAAGGSVQMTDANFTTSAAFMITGHYRTN